VLESAEGIDKFIENTSADSDAEFNAGDTNAPVMSLIGWGTMSQTFSYSVGGSISGQSGSKTDLGSRTECFTVDHSIALWLGTIRTLIALTRSLHRFLRTESKFAKELPDMPFMIFDTETILDQLGYQRACPKLGLEAEITRTSQQQFAEIVEIFLSLPRGG
jgi:hypothetical protein